MLGRRTLLAAAVAAAAGAGAVRRLAEPADPHRRALRHRRRHRHHHPPAGAEAGGDPRPARGDREPARRRQHGRHRLRREAAAERRYLRARHPVAHRHRARALPAPALRSAAGPGGGRAHGLRARSPWPSPRAASPPRTRAGVHRGAEAPRPGATSTAVVGHRHLGAHRLRQFLHRGTATEAVHVPYRGGGPGLRGADRRARSSSPPTSPRC